MAAPQNSANIDPSAANYIDRNYPLNVQSFMHPFALNQQQIYMQQQQQQQENNDQRVNKFQLAPMSNTRDANQSSDFHYDEDDYVTSC